MINNCKYKYYLKRKAFNKAIQVFATVMLILVSIVPAFASNTVYTEDTLYYTVADESITITGCFGKEKTIEVPASIAGIPVNTIAKGAFTDNLYLKTLKLPDTITTVQSGAIGDNIEVIYNYNTKPSSDPGDVTEEPNGNTGGNADGNSSASSGSEAGKNTDNSGTAGGKNSDKTDYSSLKKGETVSVGGRKLTVKSRDNDKIVLEDEEGLKYHVKDGNIISDETGESLTGGDAVAEGEADLTEAEAEADRPIRRYIIGIVIAVIILIPVLLYLIRRIRREHEYK